MERELRTLDSNLDTIDALLGDHLVQYGFTDTRQDRVGQDSVDHAPAALHFGAA